MLDVIVVGGSYAGLAAAMPLGRARRSVLVIDAGQRRNRFAASSHGFLGQDGEAPAAIAAKGREELLAYPTVSWRTAAVTETRKVDEGFIVRTGSDEYRSKRLILATGVADELPPIPGLAERWGRTVFHCPYCHGYELGLGRLAVLATDASAMHQVLLVSEWSERGQMMFFLNGAFEPDAAELAEVESHGIHVERELVTAVTGDAPTIDIHLRDGRTIARDGVFVAPRTVMKTPFAEQLGCELETGPTGAFFKTDATKATSVPGVFACGDAARPFGNVPLAVADGFLAGVAAHRSLVFHA